MRKLRLGEVRYIPQVTKLVELGFEPQKSDSIVDGCALSSQLDYESLLVREMSLLSLDSHRHSKTTE
jgi:hypothetical protein